MGSFFGIRSAFAIIRIVAPADILDARDGVDMDAARRVIAGSCGVTNCESARVCAQAIALPNIAKVSVAPMNCMIFIVVYFLKQNSEENNALDDFFVPQGLAV